MPNNSRKKLHKTLFAILLGTALEYYDIALFAFIAPMLAQVFLPQLQPTTGTMIMFFTYGLGVIARPLGSYIFGRIGDKYGRIKPLYITIYSMAIISALLSITPDYDAVGIYGIIIFTTFRILQQFFVSGHFNGGAIYCLEHSQGIYRPGFVSGIYNAATVVGIIFAACVAMLLSHFGTEFWRIGYLIGVAGAAFASLMRKHIIETPAFLKYNFLAKNNLKKNKNKKLSIIFSISITLVSLLFGMLYAFSAKILNVIIPEISSFEISLVLSINFYIIVCYFFLLVLSGYISDFIGARYQMIFTCIIAIPALFLVSIIKYTNVFSIFFAKFIIIALVALLFGPAHSYFVSELEVHKRYRVISMLYTIGKVLSGFSPALFLYIWNTSSNQNYIALYISIVAVITMLFLILNTILSKRC